MKRLIVLSLIFILLNGISEAKHLNKEAYYQQKWCRAKGGITEYKLDDNTRVDCLLKDKAVEFDFASKWAECTGQALYYGIKTNRKGACALIMENGTSDLKYLKRLNTTAQKAGIEVIEIK